MPRALSCLAQKYAEFYGVKEWELSNNPEKAQNRCSIKEEHLNFMLRNLNISQAMSYFRRIQVDEGGVFEAPKEVIVPELSEEAKRLKEEMIE